jgi:hypothetical protein
MKLSITVGLFAATGAFACSRESHPELAHAPSTSAMQTALVSTAQPTEAGAPSIPTNNPAVPAPVAPRAAQPEEVPLTPSSSPGEPRPVAAPLVPVDPTLDKPESRDDEESIREIRAQLAADTSLSPAARRVSIVARKGRVRLSGQVNTAEERAAVERAARRAANVIDVRNELVVLQ